MDVADEVLGYLRANAPRAEDPERIAFALGLPVRDVASAVTWLMHNGEVRGAGNDCWRVAGVAQVAVPKHGQRAHIMIDAPAEAVVILAAQQLAALQAFAARAGVYISNSVQVEPDMLERIAVAMKVEPDRWTHEDGRVFSSIREQGFHLIAVRPPSPPAPQAEEAPAPAAPDVDGEKGDA